MPPCARASSPRQLLTLTNDTEADRMLKGRLGSAHNLPATAEISQNLGYSERFLSTSLTNFWLATNAGQRLADQNDICLQQLAQDFLRAKGQKLWGARGRVPRYPDDTETLRNGILMILSRQKRSTGTRQTKEMTQPQRGIEAENKVDCHVLMDSPNIGHPTTGNITTPERSVASSLYAGDSCTPDSIHQHMTPSRLSVVEAQPSPVIVHSDHWSYSVRPIALPKHKFGTVARRTTLRSEADSASTTEGEGPPPPYDSFLTARFSTSNRSSLSIASDQGTSASRTTSQTSHHHVMAHQHRLKQQTPRPSPDKEEPDDNDLMRSSVPCSEIPRQKDLASKHNTLTRSWKRVISNLHLNRNKELSLKRTTAVLRHAQSCLSLRGEYKQKMHAN